MWCLPCCLQDRLNSSLEDSLNLCWITGFKPYWDLYQFTSKFSLVEEQRQLSYLTWQYVPQGQFVPKQICFRYFSKYQVHIKGQCLHIFFFRLNVFSISNNKNTVDNYHFFFNVNANRSVNTNRSVHKFYGGQLQTYWGYSIFASEGLIIRFATLVYIQDFWAI